MNSASSRTFYSLSLRVDSINIDQLRCSLPCQKILLSWPRTNKLILFYHFHWHITIDKNTKMSLEKIARCLPAKLTCNEQISWHLEVSSIRHSVKVYPHIIKHIKTETDIVVYLPLVTKEFLCVCVCARARVLFGGGGKEDFPHTNIFSSSLLVCYV